TVTALAAAPFTGGASLYPLLYAGMAGAALNLGTHMLVSGSDFEFTARNVSRRIAGGFVEGAAAFLTPAHMGAIFGLGERAGMAAARATAAHLAESGIATLTREGEAALQREMTTLMRESLAHMQGGVTQAALNSAAERLVAQGVITNAQRQALVS